MSVGPSFWGEGGGKRPETGLPRPSGRPCGQGLFPWSARGALPGPLYAPNEKRGAAGAKGRWMFYWALTNSRQKARYVSLV